MRRRLMLSAGLVLMPLAALAHAAKIGPNGGPQVDAGPLHLEMIVQDATMTIYLRDHADKPVPTDGYKGTAIFLLDGRSQRIALVPAGENKLVGTAPVKLPPNPRGAVQLVSPSGATIQGRFN